MLPPKEIRLDRCRIFEGERIHVGTCHGHFENCWNRAMTKKELRAFLKSAPFGLVVSNIDELDTISD